MHQSRPWRNICTIIQQFYYFIIIIINPCNLKRHQVGFYVRSFLYFIFIFIQIFQFQKRSWSPHIHNTDVILGIAQFLQYSDNSEAGLDDEGQEEISGWLGETGICCFTGKSYMVAVVLGPAFNCPEFLRSDVFKLQKIYKI